MTDEQRAKDRIAMGDYVVAEINSARRRNDASWASTVSADADADGRWSRYRAEETAAFDRFVAEVLANHAEGRRS